MARHLTTVLLCFLLAACQQPEKPTVPLAVVPSDPKVLTDAEKKTITDEILRNWDMDVLKGCPWGDMPPVQLLIRLSPDAAVTGIERSIAIGQDVREAPYESAEHRDRTRCVLAMI